MNPVRNVVLMFLSRFNKVFMYHKQRKKVIAVAVLCILTALFCFCEDPYSIDTAKCQNCGTCIGVCPENAIHTENDKAVIDPDKCEGCGKCAAACPQKAIHR